MLIEAFLQLTVFRVANVVPVCSMSFFLSNVVFGQRWIALAILLWKFPSTTKSYSHDIKTRCSLFISWHELIQPLKFLIYTV